jgi:hypothetical protein
MSRHSLATMLVTAAALPVLLAAQTPQPATPAPAVGVPAGQLPAAQARRLPVRRVVLYKNGIGFFEHLGQVTGRERLSIDFTSAQLDDVLKSLTVLDLNGGTVGAVGYNSDAPLSRRLGALRLPLDGGASASALLGALRGARIEVTRGGVAATGRLLGVERRRAGQGTNAADVDHLSVITDGGDVRVFELGPGTGVRLMEKDLNDRVGRYLGLVASERDRDLRRMTIDASGQGSRRLYVSYVSEVPVWKTTYRLVLPSEKGGTALLQGWAIVDNTVGEDWNDVELSLVAGAPVSFIQQLSQPLYRARPVVPLPSGALVAPQTHAGTMTAGSGSFSGQVTDTAGTALPGASVRLVSRAGLEAGRGVSGPDGSFRLGDVPDGEYTAVAELPGFLPASAPVSVAGGASVRATLVMGPGSMSEAVYVTSDAAGAPPPAPPPPSAAARAYKRAAPGGVVGGVLGGLPDAPPADYARQMALQTAAASGRDLGDLFEYKLDRPVSIRQNQSALVPILQANVGAERVSLWAPGGATGERPLNAVWITNTSPYTLDGGSLTLLDRNTYAGEGLTDPIKPGERRLLSYSVDLAVRVQPQESAPAYRVSRMRAARGVLVTETLSCTEHTYTVRNEDAAARTVVVEHPQSAGWTLAPGTPAPAETSSSAYRFSVPVEPKQSASFVVREARAEESRTAVSDLGDDQVTVIVRDLKADAKTTEALRAIMAKKAEMEAVDRAMAAKDSERETIGGDQERVRENMKALKGSAEEKRLLERYVQQLATQEDRLAVLKGETDELQARRVTLQGEITGLVEAFSFEASVPGVACGAK